MEITAEALERQIRKLKEETNTKKRAGVTYCHSKWKQGCPDECRKKMKGELWKSLAVALDFRVMKQKHMRIQNGKKLLHQTTIDISTNAVTETAKLCKTSDTVLRTVKVELRASNEIVLLVFSVVQAGDTWVKAFRGDGSHAV